ncbi:uncharacterized protein BT62DRAFT_577972 [Guyanagaster necrorhizus]|uniref:DUF6533 domain-containing protein n=1 Tax=Guyanagaster necrorhizus TaxID=856835 RepID=A0A9P8AM79_9AGAR|nr:uncharacterized protein BT62DRAFT_577972 [Guyanagaster necrorhizus MCA 3950]KAG7440600.1 hypothetical protein BT62DRAFT_577972 [Guyanagaster necrorhizus MCA 3950]
MDSTNGSLESIETAFQHTRLVGYMDVSSVALLLYDYTLTLSLEVDLVWCAPWSLLKLFYIVQRYLPFFDTAFLVLYHQFAPELSIRYCQISHSMSGWMFTTGIAISEVILTARVWAVWECNKKLTFGLPVFFLLCWAPNFAMMGVFLKSMKFGPAPLPSLGCFVTTSDDILYLCWTCLMIYDTGMLLLMLVAGVRAYKTGGDSALFNVVFRDGVMYYAYLFVISVINVAMILSLPRDLVHLLSSAERVIHALLTSRVVLDIRAQGKRTEIDQMMCLETRSSDDCTSVGVWVTQTTRVYSDSV